MSDQTTPPTRPLRRTFTPPEIIEARQVRDYLSSKFRECYAAPGPDCGECEQCTIAAAVERLTTIVEPPDLPVEKSRDRLSYNDGINAESYLLAAWQFEQNQARSVGHGRKSILEHLLGDRPTFRDAQVAATLIQWLGTNVGLGFLQKLTDARDRAYADGKAKRDTKRDASNV